MQPKVKRKSTPRPSNFHQKTSPKWVVDSAPLSWHIIRILSSGFHGLKVVLEDLEMGSVRWLF